MRCHTAIGIEKRAMRSDEIATDLMQETTSGSRMEYPSHSRSYIVFPFWSHRVSCTVLCMLVRCQRSRFTPSERLRGPRRLVFRISLRSLAMLDQNTSAVDPAVLANTEMKSELLTSPFMQVKRAIQRPVIRPDQ